MKLILGAVFWFIFWKGMEKDRPFFMWGGLVMSIIMFIWEMFIIWIKLSVFFIPF